MSEDLLMLNGEMNASVFVPCSSRKDPTHNHCSVATPLLLGTQIGSNVSYGHMGTDFLGTDWVQAFYEPSKTLLH